MQKYQQDSVTKHERSNIHQNNHLLPHFDHFAYAICRQLIGTDGCWALGTEAMELAHSLYSNGPEEAWFEIRSRLSNFVAGNEQKLYRTNKLFTEEPVHVACC